MKTKQTNGLLRLPGEAFSAELTFETSNSLPYSFVLRIILVFWSFFKIKSGDFVDKNWRHCLDMSKKCVSIDEWGLSVSRQT